VRLAILWVVVVVGLGAACGREAPAEPLHDVALPDLSRLDASVRAQVRGKYAALERVRSNEGASAAQRGTAYGEFAMLLHAAEFYNDADPAYRNAQTLMPSDPRWPYYLAHVRRSIGDSAQTITLLTRVLELRPDDVPALVWLGRAYLDQGQPDQAEPLFTRALAAAPMTLAAKVGLAQIAIGRKEFARAVTLLEEGFQILPTADSLHSLMATAYRGLGNTAKADEHLKRWRNTDVLVQDPLREELDLALESGLSYELRGVRVMTDGDYPAAADFFRRGIALTQGTTQLGRSLRHKLGTALYLQGRVPEAVAQFEEVVRLAPPRGQDEPTAKAYYSLGVLQASEGRTPEAIASLTRAVQYSPSYLEAQMALGDALRAAGRVEASLEPYRAAVEGNPRAGEARFGYAMALIRLQRWREARASLEESTRVLPDRIDLSHALARVLAAAPDAAVRDGRRALALTEALMQTTRTPDVGETLAMAHAELGRFEEAAMIQRSVIDAARRAGDQAAIRRMTTNLRLYERRQPCRTPWADDDPVHAATPK
jgi:tetratricopeptide (TPR) repeat protein